MAGVNIEERARRERIRILLRTRNDLYPSPRAKATPYTVSGPAPGRKRKCPACDGTGKVRRWQKCQVCDGTRKLAVDSYVGRVTDSDARKPEPMSPERRESELQRLQSSLDLSAGQADPNEAYGWERNIEARNKQGSYRELERALEQLREEDPVGWEFLTTLYGWTEERGGETIFKVERSGWADAREAYLVGQVARFMPAKIKLPYRLHEELMDDKRRRVKEMLRCGLEPQEIAERVLLSERTIVRMVQPT